MAKNTEGTNAFGMKLTPDSFGVGEKKQPMGMEQQDGVEQPAVTQPTVVRHGSSKSLTKNISITLQEDAIRKLNALADAQGVSRSKFVNNWIMSL